MQQPIDTNDPQVFATVKENQYFDRKSARKDTDEIAKHIIAFANFAGGKLVIGIEASAERVITRRKDKAGFTAPEGQERDPRPRAGDSARIRQEPAALRGRGG